MMLKKILPAITIFLTVALIAIINSSFTKFLIGWDNLIPEFSFDINIQRSFFAVWQEYQGTGLLGGMGHASDLVRQLVLLCFSPVMPLNGLRFTWTFLMLFLGPVGAYYLIKNVVLARSSIEEPSKQFTSFLGGIFYLLNLSTVQVFYAPYEAFTTHFAFIPWFLLTSLLFLQNPNKKNCLFLALVLLLGTPSNYVPTLFIVSVFSVALLAISLAVINRNMGILKSFAKLIFIIFAINAFWLLPFLYFIFVNSHVAFQAKINQMATETVFLQNKAFGDIWNTMLLKGFWFNNIDPNFSNKFEYMMSTWRTHLTTFPIIATGYALFAIIIFGFMGAIKKKLPILTSFSILFLFAFTMLTTNTVPFSWINNLFRKIPLFDQAFRFPFTKFSVLASLCFSVFFALGTMDLTKTFKRLFCFRKINSFVFSFLFLILSIILVLPIFYGKLFYEKEILSFPKEYFQLFNYFKNQDENSRIANFPQATYWGWNYYKWGYGGSGFLWYGIKQPILDRAFDVWSKNNENYYWEISRALYSEDSVLFKKILNKYQISFILIDENVISTSSPKALFFSELKQILGKIPEIKKDAEFGKISVYKVNLNLKQNTFISAVANLPSIGPSYQWNDFDIAYIQHDNYISDDKSQVYYPFRSLFTGRKQEDLEFKIYDKESYLSFQTQIPIRLKGGALVIPNFYEEEVYEFSQDNVPKKTLKIPQVFIDTELVKIDTQISSSLSADNLNSIKVFLPYINNGTLEVRIPKFSGYNNYNSRINNDLFSRTFKECNLFTKGLNQQVKMSKDILRLKNYNSSTCFEFNLASLSSRLGYMVSFKNKNIEGKSLLLSIINLTSQKPNLESNLSKNKNLIASYFVIPPMQIYGLGYNLYFDNTSLGNVMSTNELSNISVNQIPYRFLTSLKIEKDPMDKASLDYSNNLNVSHPNESLYTINIIESLPQETVLILSQSFNSGWKAYQVDKLSFLNKAFPFIFGKEITDHVLINNWENGWIIKSPESKNIVIVYLPQYLEYLGILIAIATICYLIFGLKGTGIKIDLEK